MWFQACHLPSTLNSLCVAILSQLEQKGVVQGIFLQPAHHTKQQQHSSVVGHWHKSAWPLRGTNVLCSCCWGVLMLLTCWWTMLGCLLSMCWLPGSVICQVVTCHMSILKQQRESWQSLQVAQAVQSSGDGICLISQLGHKLQPPGCAQWCNSVSFWRQRWWCELF